MSAAIYQRVAERAAEAGIAVSPEQVEKIDLLLFVETDAERREARIQPGRLAR